ncbi:fibronectin type III-like domain-contianing protein [Sphingomonas sp. MMS24-JH45]
MRLAGFERVTLAPGETRRVGITADPRIVADYDVARRGWRIGAGRYRVDVGHAAGDAALTADVVLAAQQLKP